MKQLKELVKLELLREQEIRGEKNEKKMKSNLLNYDINDVFKGFRV